MSYIEKLRSLNETDLKKEIENLIRRSSHLLIRDKARLDIVSGDLEGSWDVVDEVHVDEISIAPENPECRVKFGWESYGPHDEDDERVLNGWATACIADDRLVSFVDTGAKLEGSRPSRPMGGSAADAWWSSLDEDNREGRTDDMNKDS